MIVAGLQMDIAWEDPRENFRRVREMVARAVEGAPAGAVGAPHLLVLPETFATGFSMEAEKMAAFAAETLDFLAEIARAHAVHVLGGYAMPADPRPANACSLVDPTGKEILHYRKLHPFSMAGEDEHYLAGEILATAEVQGVRVTPLICYDLRFPEPFRAAASGTELFCVLANWPAKRRQVWSTLLRARAMENQAYVLGVNRVGPGGGEAHAGDSVLLGPLGEDVAAAADGRPDFFAGEVDPGEVARVRDRFSALRDRRPELYRRLEEERSLSRS